MTYKILKSGPFTTIQDKGRWGYQRFGMSVAGAMDGFSTRVANLLVDNDEWEAVLECTFIGPTIEFSESDVIAITGANMSPRLNGMSIPMWTSIPVEAGDVLALDRAVSGLRSYIAFSRGLNVPAVMGSKSTFIRGKIGGHEGRKLKDGDTIKSSDKSLPKTGSAVPNELIPKYEQDGEICLVLGPQDDAFTEEGIKTLFNSTYTITTEADRMGYRLAGEKIEHKTGADIISDGIVFGSVQVPGQGVPIIMMADRATTGGYTKIATVIARDLIKLAQMAPGAKLTFKEVSVEESRELYLKEEEKLNRIKKYINEKRYSLEDSMQMQLNINGESFNVMVMEIE